MANIDMAYEELSGLLEPGERVLWIGQGRPRLDGGAVVMAISGLAFSAFSIAMIWTLYDDFTNPSRLGASPHNLPHEPFFYAGLAAFMMMLSGGIFFLITGISEIGRPRWPTPCYGLTDRRVLLLPGGYAQEAMSVPLRHLTLVTITLWERAGGSGTIVFGAGWQPGQLYWDECIVRSHYAPYWSGHEAPRLERIPDARRVYRLIQKAIADAARGRR